MWFKNHLLSVLNCIFGLFRPQILIFVNMVPDALAWAEFLLFSVRLGTEGRLLVVKLHM